jgi:UDP-N-acetylmuramoyl-L-alanyl-D-glutamate--2,6-diaminopimelate ligase
VTLRELFEEVEGVEVGGSLDTNITGLAFDSRRVRPGDLFFGLSGLKQDGQAYVRQALTAGAVAAVVGRDIHAPGATLVRVDEPRKALAQASARFFRHPSRTLQVVGVTGTNGKTTTTWMLESIFRAAGLAPGVIGTTGYRFAGESRVAPFTTPEAPDLQGLLREMADRGVQALAIEVSSHALVQFRSYGLECDVVAFINLTQDHLDYHGTMDAYLDAKLRLFDGRNGPTSKRAIAVVNADDPAATRVIAAAEKGGMRVVRYAVEVEGRRFPTGPLEIRFAAVKPRAEGLAFTVFHDGQDFEARLPLLGSYNAWNAAASMCAALKLGIPMEKIVVGLATMPTVPGRLERVSAGQPFDVVVDYAHTPDALARALDACREHSRGRLLLVFGCGGDRDKRPLMGRIAASKADQAWVANDNPRSEDPATIAAEIVAGASATRSLAVELDRRAAIAAALDAATAGDLVLIAGKGHETTQTIGDRVLPFDDREVAREVLRARRSAT